MKKIKNKIFFIYNIVILGAEIKSKIILLIHSIIILSTRKLKIKPIKFYTFLGTSKNKIKVNFVGTTDELHALTEIFVENCYKPSNTPNVIIDMGANIGLATIWFKINYPDSIIYAYEANPYIFKILEKNVSTLKNVRCYNLAISDKNEKIEFNYSNRSFSSSEFPIPNSKKIYVDAITIDEAIKNTNEIVDLIKIDIEGSEFSTIKNSNKINQVNEIIGEIHPEKAEESPLTITNKLENSHEISYVGYGKSLFHAIIK